jgi:hypothetical protein
MTSVLPIGENASSNAFASHGVLGHEQGFMACV